MDTDLFKKYWFWVAVVLVIGLFGFFLRVDLSEVPTGKSSILIDFGNGLSKKFEGPVTSDMTVLEALYSASINSPFDFRYSIDKNGALEISKIGGSINFGDKLSWHFWLNGQSVDAAKINQTKIRSGDTIEAKYE